MRRTLALTTVTTLTAVAAATLSGSALAADPLPALLLSSDRGGDSEIVLRAPDGTTRELTRNRAIDHNAVWSPDGRRIAFVSDRDDDDDVYVMDADGSGVRHVTRNSRTRSGMPVRDAMPAWSPDGRRIVFSSTCNRGQHDLFTMRNDGADIRRLTGHTSLDDVFPRWTPDGRQVVFSTFAGPEGAPSEDVWAVHADGTGRRRLTTSAAAEWGPDPRPALR